MPYKPTDICAVFNKRQITVAREEDKRIESGWGDITWGEWCEKTVQEIGNSVEIVRPRKGSRVMAIAMKKLNKGDN